MDYLNEELSIVKPKAVLAFGGDALRSIRDTLSPETPVKDLSGLKKFFLSKKVFEWNGVRVYPIPHPNGIWRDPVIPQKEYENIVRWYIRQIEKL